MPTIKPLTNLLWYSALALVLGAVGTVAWHDYAWFVRLQQQTPAGAQLSSLEYSTNLWRPWSLITPVVTGFIRTEGPFEVIEHNGQWLLEIHHSQFSAPATSATQTSIRILRCPDGLFALRDAKEEPLTLGQLSEDDPLLDFCETL